MGLTRTGQTKVESPEGSREVIFGTCDAPLAEGMSVEFEGGDFPGHLIVQTLESLPEGRTLADLARLAVEGQRPGGILPKGDLALVIFSNPSRLLPYYEVAVLVKPVGVATTSSA